MAKVYERINWEDLPSKNTPINAENLNKMDKAINDLDDKIEEASEGGFYSKEQYVSLAYAPGGTGGGGQVEVSNEPVAVTDELEAETWLFNFNVTFSSYTPPCNITLWLGQSYNTIKSVKKGKTHNFAETISFSFIVTAEEAFTQYLLIDCDTSQFDGSSGTDSACSIKVNAVKIA